MFPFGDRNLRIHSLHDAATLVKKLNNVTAPRDKCFQRVLSEKEFIGAIDEEGFEISRNVYYGRLIYAPTIIGKFCKSDTGIEIEVVMSPNPMAIILLPLMFIIAIIVGVVYRDKRTILFMILFLVLLAIIYGGGTMSELDFAEKKIKEIAA